MTVKNFIKIKEEIKEKIENLKFNHYDPCIVAVSKTFQMSHINHLLDYGHLHFGENKVQEAIQKWSEVKENKKEIKLHMLGKLQTNKVKLAIRLFDYIHSVDNMKLVEKIANEQTKINRTIKIFLQVNIGEEDQKSGANLNELDSLFNFCKDCNLDVIGLMCLPPFDKNPDEYFQKLKNLNDNFKFKDISMGMSQDYLNAIKYKSTFLRIGSKIFGERN